MSLALVKPQLLVVIVGLLLWKRQWKPLAALGAVAVILAGLSVAVAGPDVLFAYPGLLLRSAGWQHEKGINLTMMYGWNGFFASLVGGGFAHSLLTWGAVLVTLATVAWAWSVEWDPSSPAFLMRIAIALAGTMLISVHFYRQDMTLAVLLLALGGAYWRLTGAGGWGWWPGIAAGFWAIDGLGYALLVKLGVNIQTPALAVLLFALIYTLQARRKSPVREVEGVSSDLALAA